MPELLLELLCEEIPARMQGRAADDLKRAVAAGLKDGGLVFQGAQAYATPRRLTLVVEGLPEQQPDLVEERKGPREGAPDQAIQGFLKGNGLKSLDQAELKDTGKGRFYFFVKKTPGRPTAAVLPAVLVDAIKAVTWPKSMRWAGNRFRWVRPLHAVLAVFEGERLEGGLDLGEETLAFTGESVGHRLLAPDAFPVTSFRGYAKRLKAAKVILDPAERRRLIEEKAAALAKESGLSVKEEPALLEEVTGLVEWPEVVIGRIDEAFMDLPPEVLTTAMRHHQRYFATLDKKGKLGNRFLIVANMPARAGTKRWKNIVAGNERVLRARLSDARFFWDQDRRTSLAGRAPTLEQIVFHAKLGTLDAKVDRMQALAAEISRHVDGADMDRVRSAARLAKADLSSGMVGEFPELQGIMGRYYARHDGEHEDVATAIAEHYAPQGPNDACPSAPVSVCVALADKIDSLVGFFAIGETPTGSKDPYALRRAALGVIRLLVENRLRLPLRPIFESAWEMFRARRIQLRTSVETCDDLMDFFADRLKVALRDKGIRHDLISAVFALGDEDDLVRLLDRVAALDGFLHTDDGANLLVAYRRAANIVRIEEKRDNSKNHQEVLSALFVQDEENALWQNLHAVQDSQTYSIEHEHFAAAMEGFSQLRGPVDRFFDNVTVNHEDPKLRANRLALLNAIVTVMNQVADFSKIEG